MEHSQIFRQLAANQLPTGQFPTVALNIEEGTQRQVNTLTPTYLICLLLSCFRERHWSDPALDRIIMRCCSYIERSCCYDPIAGHRVWRFNLFYGPDWEETCWCSLLLFQAGLLRRNDLEALYQLLWHNETEQRGVGVWVKDDYSQNNRYNNAFDLIVSLSIQKWLESIFRTRSVPTDKFISASVYDGQMSMYYFDAFTRFLLYLFGLADKPAAQSSNNTPLFHHGNRQQIQYIAPDVWTAASLFTDA